MQTIGSRSGSTARRAKTIALCRRCRRQILPKGYGSSLRPKDLHRTAAKDMVRSQAPDPDAERIRRRKERKARTRQHVRDTAILAALRSRDLHAAQRIVLELRGERATTTPPDEECPECRNRQRGA